MEIFKVGDRVEITRTTHIDSGCNVKLSNVAKIVGVYRGEQGWFYCSNPNWGVSKILMKYDQLKKL